VISFTGNLRSSEHDRDFGVQDQIEIVKEQNTANKFFLYLNGQNITDRFKQVYQEVKNRLQNDKKENGNGT